MILLAAAHHDGPAWYRVEVPGQWLRARGREIRIAYKEVTAQHFEDGVKVFMVQRGWHESFTKGAGQIRGAGIKLVYELDDDVWNVPSWNPMKPHFNPAHLRQMETALRACDMAIATTPRLVEVLSKYNKDVRLIPNAVPLGIFNYPQVSPGGDGAVRIGWFGSGTHQHDFDQATMPLERILATRPNVKMVFMGWTPMKFRDHPQVESHSWVPAEQYYSTLAGLRLDMLAAPLAEHRFNDSKSNIKAIEAASFGWPIIASDVGPYRSLPEEIGLRVKRNTYDGWVRAISQLIDNPDLRQKMGRAGTEWVKANHTVDHTGPLWEEALLDGVELISAESAGKPSLIAAGGKA